MTRTHQSEDTVLYETWHYRMSIPPYGIFVSQDEQHLFQRTECMTLADSITPTAVFSNGGREQSPREESSWFSKATNT